ncbi:MAG: hypothetical protein RL748_1483, partial [Pseudomonadota bacterium]
ARITPGWEQRFNEVQELRQKLIPLDARHEAGEELSLEEEIERASLWGQIGRDPAQVLELWQQLLQRAPDNARVCLALGSRLLELQDDSACALLARAAQLEEHFQLLVYRNLRDYYRVRQDDVNAQIWQEKLSVRAELEQNAEDERSRIQPGDQFEPHGLPEPQLAALLQQLKQHETIRHVWLVRKTVQYLPHQPCYLLGFSCSSMLTLHTDGRANAVIEALQRQVQFPEGTVIFCVDGDNAHFSKKMDKVAGSKLF